jgi:TP901 family phage tail tape measure protein
VADLRKVVEIIVQGRNTAGPALQQAGRQVVSLAQEVLSLRTVLSGVLPALSVGAVGAFIKSQIDAADAVRDFAQRTNMAVEEVSLLKYVGEQTGTSMQALATSTKILTTQAYDAAKGSDEASKKFERLGIKVTDANGQLRSGTELLKEVSRVIRNLPTAEQNPVAVDLLGRNAPEVLEFLRLGPEAMEQMAKHGREIGAIISQEEAERADAFNDTLKDASTAVGALGRDIGLALVPKLTEVVRGFTDAAAAVRTWQREQPAAVANAESLVRVLGWTAGLAWVVDALAFRLNLATIWAGGFWKALLGPIGLVAGVISVLLELDRRVDQVSKTAEKAARRPGRQPGQASPADAAASSGFESDAGAYDPVKEAADRLKKKFDRTKEPGPLSDYVPPAKDLVEVLKDLNAEVDKFELPAKIRDALVELARYRQVLASEIPQAVRDLNARELQEFRKQPLEREPAPGLKDLPDDSADRRAQRNSIADRRIDLESLGLPYEDPWLRDQEAREAALADFTAGIVGLREIGVGAAQDIAHGFGETVYGFLTGEAAVESWGKTILRAVAAAIAGLAEMVVQLVLVKSLFAIFDGGPFTPFKGIGKIFGLERGGAVGLASGGLVTGGGAGVDAAGPVFLNRGELVTPAPITARLSSFLDKALVGGKLAGAGNIFNVTIPVTTGAFYSKAEELTLMTRIRDGLLELQGSRF